MIRTVEELVDVTAKQFMAGDIEQIADCYATPVPVYTAAGIETHVTRDELVAQLRSLRETYLNMGVQDMSAKIVARSLPRGGKARIVLDWEYHLGGNQQPLRSSITYFCRMAEPRFGLPLTIEMVEYRQTAADSLTPDTFAEHPFNRKDLA